MNKPDRVEQTLSLARGALAPPAAQQARVRSALGPTPWLSALHGAPLPAAPVPSAPPATPAARAGLQLGARSGAVLAVAFVAAVGSSFASGYRLGHERAAGEPPALPSALAMPSEPAAIAPSAELPPSAAEPASDRAERRASRSRPRSEAVPPGEPASPEQVRPDELALLRRVERALRGGEPAVALALLAELDERFPNSALREERRASHTMAHCQLRSPGAAQRAAAFLREHSASVYADPVRVTCGTLEGAGH